MPARAGAQGVEIFAARQHFDYTSREACARAGRVVPLQYAAAVLHARAACFPIARWAAPARPRRNVIHPDKSRRIDAMDEIKRALETAEQIPIKHLIVHLGERDDGWSQRTIDYALTALEHLGAFARALGVRVLVENLTSEPTTPEHLVTILDLGHLDSSASASTWATRT